MKNDKVQVRSIKYNDSLNDLNVNVDKSLTNTLIDDYILGLKHDHIETSYIHKVLVGMAPLGLLATKKKLLYIGHVCRMAANN